MADFNYVARTVSTDRYACTQFEINDQDYRLRVFMDAETGEAYAEVLTEAQYWAEIRR